MIEGRRGYGLNGRRWSLLFYFVLLLVSLPLHSQTKYDIVILGGRVMDPESGLDAVRNVAIQNRRIVAISSKRLEGRHTIVAAGMVVAPGFIDLHQHSQTEEAYRAKVLDGVTTALEMEEGVADIDQFCSEREGKARINFGATIGHEHLRKALLQAAEPKQPNPTGRALTKQEIQALREKVEHGLSRGAPGVGILMLDTPEATPEEVLEMFRAAAKFPGATVYMHVRELKQPQYWLETDEVLTDSLITGAPVQIVHVNSTYEEDVEPFLGMVAAARARGVDVTTEAYPYTASMSAIESISPDWEKWPDEKFQEFEWPVTGERLTRETFAKYHKQGGDVIHYKMTDDVLRPAIISPLTMIASDGILAKGVGHPRVAGTYSRIMGRYVREQKAFTLMEALRKSTLMPVQRLEARVPSMKNKGRIRVGADADLTIFNPDTVIDRATYREPAKAPQGIEFVMVSGVVVVSGGKIQEDAFPGKCVRAPIERQ